MLQRIQTLQDWSGKVIKQTNSNNSNDTKIITTMTTKILFWEGVI